MVSSTLSAESGVLCQADVDIATRATGVCPRVRFGSSGGVGWMVFQYVLVIFYLVTDAVSLYTVLKLTPQMYQRADQEKAYTPAPNSNPSEEAYGGTQAKAQAGFASAARLNPMTRLTINP